MQTQDQSEKRSFLGNVFLREIQNWFHVRKKILCLGRGGGGQVVSLLAFYSNDVNLNPTEVYSFILYII